MTSAIRFNDFCGWTYLRSSTDKPFVNDNGTTTIKLSVVTLSGLNFIYHSSPSMRKDYEERYIRELLVGFEI